MQDKNKLAKHRHSTNSKKGLKFFKLETIWTYKHQSNFSSQALRKQKLYTALCTDTKNKNLLYTI